MLLARRIHAEQPAIRINKLRRSEYGRAALVGLQTSKVFYECINCRRLNGHKEKCRFSFRSPAMLRLYFGLDKRMARSISTVEKHVDSPASPLMAEHSKL